MTESELERATDEELEELEALLRGETYGEFVRSVDLPGVPAAELPEDEDEYHVVRVEPADHHELLIERLEAVEAGFLKRLIVLMPPGSAKSTYASVGFPPWYLGKKGRRSLICSSYGSALPKKFGRRCRNLIRTPEYQSVMGVELAGDSQAADEWRLTNGSEYMAAGILAGITGNRADGLIIDDPIKGREDADSLTIREKTWEAYKSDLRTRLKPNGFIVLILTRWHEDDPAGRILPDDYDGRSGWITAKDGEEWYVLSLQAQCEHEDDPLGRKIGEYIWPEWFGAEHFEQEKISQGDRNWASLFQQRPSPESGTYFQSDWFKFYEWNPEAKNNGAPAYLRIYGASDYAVKGKEGDFTVHGIIGIDPEDRIFVIDWWREQVTSDVWVETCIDLAQRWKPLYWAEERGQIIGGVGPFLSKRMRERRVYFSRSTDDKPARFTSSTDKATRARAIQARMRMGMVYFPKGAPWLPDLTGELTRFNGQSEGVDDQVDVLSLFGRMLDEMHKGTKQRRVPDTSYDSPEFIRQQLREMEERARG